MKPRAIAIPTVLLVIALVVVIVVSVASVGLANLHLANVDTLSKQSLYAAEAGIARSIREIVRGNQAFAGFMDEPFGQQSTFSVQVVRGPDPGFRPPVPDKFVYLLAVGETRGKHPRKVGVMLTFLAPGQASSAFTYAIATGGRLDSSGGGQIVGSIKANEDLTIGGGIRLKPAGGEGRVLSAEDIQLGNGVKRDTAQDVRARDEIRIGNRTQTTDYANQIFPSDNTPASAPFIADGRFTNSLNTGEVGEVLPNPDPVALLGLTSDGAGGYQIDSTTGLYVMDPNRPDVVQHPETDIGGTFDLAGKIHFFPNGVRFQGDLSGRGTIVAGAGNGVEFNRALRDQEVNILALRWPRQQPGGGNPSIKFANGPNSIRGLVLAHEDVEARSNFSLTGMIVCYRPGGGDFDNQGGNRDIRYDPTGLLLPGLETWLVPGSGGNAPPGDPQPVVVVSWQRL
ncbi:MAG: hypothetical protein AB1758_15190 [Candidatus Eremiobacterota bacterium]